MTDYTKVTIEAHEGGRLSINAEDDRGYGSGYRLAGPKFRGTNWRLLAKCELAAEDVREIRYYLRIWDEIQGVKAQAGAVQP